MRFVLLTVVVLAIGAGSAGAQTAADTGAIRAIALDYAEGWYEGNGARMARAVHPELVKRIVMWDSVSKRSVIQTMGATALVNGTFRGFGKDTPADRQEKAVSVLDVFQNVASVRVTMADWIDYLQVAKVEGRWVIVNVLWERKAKGR